MARSRSLAQRLMLLVGTALAVSMALSAAAYALYETVASRRALAADLSSQASVVGLAAAPPLQFGNARDAARALGVLKGSPTILKACLYTEQGRFFAAYPDGKTMADFPAAPPPEGTPPARGEGTLDHATRIQVDGETLGWIYLQASLAPVRQRVLYSLGVQLAFLLGAIAVVLALVARLQGSLTGPIRQLARTSQAIREGRDYDLREALGSNVDEIHTLAHTFNDMVVRLQSHAETLESEVAARTLELLQMNRELMEAKERAEEASRAKSTFLASMSHELRTPLNAVLGFAQIMAGEAGRTARDKAHLEKIMGAGEHLLELINDVLSVARIEARRLTLNLQPFELRRLIDVVQSMLRVRTDAKGLSFDVEVDPELPAFVKGDEGKLRQVLLNLLGNAAKFTEAGGVGLRVFSLPGGRVRFEVVDTGAGIASAELTHLFGTFIQTESGRRSTEGSGLGLYLSQALVGLMGGKIEAQSELGSGSTFSFEIPLAPTEALAPAQAQRRLRLEPGQPSQRHLVADDKADNRELLEELLRTAGFETRTAANGQETLEAWRTWRPDVIWMDMRMPLLDGYEATRRIRGLEREGGQRRTTIIAVTASVFDHNRRTVLEAGCDGMMGKPFREQQLFELLKTHAGVRFQEVPDEAEVRTVSSHFSGVKDLDQALRLNFLEALAQGDLEEAQRLMVGLPAAFDPFVAYVQKELEAFRIAELERLFSGEGGA